MRQGITATHVFRVEGSVTNPKAVQVTYKQNNRIVLQKQLNEIILCKILYKYMKVLPSGEIIIDEEYNVLEEYPEAEKIVENIYFIPELNAIYFLDEVKLEPDTGIMLYLSQEETFEFNTDNYVLMQVRIITEKNKSFVSTVSKMNIQECLDENLLPLGEFYPIIDKPERGNN